MRIFLIKQIDEGEPGMALPEVRADVAAAARGSIGSLAASAACRFRHALPSSMPAGRQR
jgi:hypothetical protein